MKADESQFIIALPPSMRIDTQYYFQQKYLKYGENEDRMSVERECLIIKCSPENMIPIDSRITSLLIG